MNREYGDRPCTMLERAPPRDARILSGAVWWPKVLATVDTNVVHNGVHAGSMGV